MAILVGLLSLGLSSSALSPSVCSGADTPDPRCGNGYCDAWADESCESCPGDCCSAPEPRDERSILQRLATQKNRRGWSIGIDTTFSALELWKTCPGVGLDARAGRRFAWGPIWLTPEIVMGFMRFSQPGTVLRAGLGGRLGVDVGVLEPAVFLHAGGWMLPDYVFGVLGGPGVQAGLALDARIGLAFTVGVHAAYEAAWTYGGYARGRGVTEFPSGGAHAGLVW